MDIRKKADHLVRTYDTRDPYKMIEGMNNVLLIEYPIIDARGFYQYFQRMNLIYIDERLPLHEKKLVCAHELGHMILHKTCNAVFMDTRTQFNTDKFEIEANIFAAEILIPGEVIMENLHLTIEQLSRLLGYEQKFIELRYESYFEM